MAITDNPDAYLADFGVPVVAGSVSGIGILDMPDELVGDGIAISTEYSLTVKTSEFGALAYKSSLTANGAAFTVREIRKLNDGLFSRIILSKT